MNTDRSKFWLVSRIDGLGNSPKMQHKSRDLAEIEAQRLARSNPGVKFVVVAPITGFMTPTLIPLDVDQWDWTVDRAFR